MPTAAPAAAAPHRLALVRSDTAFDAAIRKSVVPIRKIRRKTGRKVDQNEAPASRQLSRCLVRQGFPGPAGRKSRLTAQRYLQRAIVTIHDDPRFSGEEYQQQFINEWRDRAHVECLQALE